MITTKELVYIFVGCFSLSVVCFALTLTFSKIWNNTAKLRYEILTLLSMVFGSLAMVAFVVFKITFWVRVLLKG